jgi:hypothetical protein
MDDPEFDDYLCIGGVDDLDAECGPMISCETFLGEPEKFINVHPHRYFDPDGDEPPA